MGINDKLCPYCGVNSCICSQEEKEFTVREFSQLILEVLEKRHKAENLTFKDLTLEQIAIKLDGDIARLPTLLSQEYPTAKENILIVVTDLYSYMAQLEVQEKEN